MNAILNTEVKFITGNKKSISYCNEGHEYIIVPFLAFYSTWWNFLLREQKEENPQVFKKRYS